MSYIGNQPLYQAFVTDQFNGDGATVAFTMSVAPANTASVLVSVTGVLQDPSTYSVAGTTLTFSAAPPSGTGNISVRYLGIPASGVTNTAYRTVTEFTATSGQTSFTVPSYTVGFINVYRNGVRLGAADFTATTGTTVVLASGATSGDLITTESFYVSSVLNAIPATAGAVNSAYITDGAVTTAKIDSAAVTQAKLGSVYQTAGPAFRAYQSSSQSLSGATTTKIQLQTEDFDTTNAFDNTTNYRFQPAVAGYYFVEGYVYQNFGTTYAQPMIYKNGGAYKYGPYQQLYVPGVVTSVYLNGSSDYVELYCYVSAGITLNQTGQASTVFSGFLVRAA